MEEKQIKSYIYFDEENELFINVYATKEGKLCKYYILDDPISKQAAAYISMRRDLIECKTSIEYLKAIIPVSEIPQFVKTSLLFSLIIKYAKCFTSGEGRGTSLNKKDVFKKVRAVHLDFHNQTIDLRNKYLAHAGNSGHESRAMVLILNPDETNKKIEGMKYAGMKLKDDDSNTDNYISMINSVLTHVDEKVEQLKLLVDKKSKELDIEEIYEKSSIPNSEKLIPFTLTKMKK